MMQLRPYQEECLTSVAEAEANGIKRPLVCLPTGTGKTIVFTTLAQRRNGRTLILAHRDELIQQAAEKVGMVWDSASVGVVKAEQNQTGAQVVVGSVQTLSRASRLEQLPQDFDLVVTDESHHAVADSYRGIYDYLGVLDGSESDTLHLGVTATPNRTDQVGLGGVFEEVVYHKSMLDMIPDYLSDLRCVQVQTEVDVSGVPSYLGDLQSKGLSELLNTENANDLIVDAWQVHASERRTLAFCVDVQHALDLAETFRLHGVTAEAVWGAMPLEDRRTVLQSFASGKVQVVTNCQVLTEGYDNPAIDCILMARPTKSSMLYTQMIGRGTRTYPGKRDCLILDVACISERHDLVSLPDLFGLKSASEKDETLTQQLEREAVEAESAELSAFGRGITSEVVDLYRQNRASVDEFAMSRLTWVETSKGWVLNLGRDGNLRIYSAFESPDKFHVFYYQNRVKQQLTRQAVELSWAFGVSESHAREVTGGNLTLVDRNAAWRQFPASARQIACLRRMGIPHVPTLTKGEAGDLLAQAFAR